LVKSRAGGRSRRGSGSFTACALVLVWLAASFGHAAPASAITVGCDTAPGTSWFDGVGEPSDATEQFSTGARANLPVRQGGFCGQPPVPTQTSYYAWVMAAAPSGNWAQVGFAQFAATAGITHFSEYTYLGGYVDKFGASATIGTVYSYSVFDDTTCPCYRMYENSTQVDKTVYDPAAHWTFPLSLQFFGETGNATDQQPGESTAKTHFGSIETQVLGSSWQAFRPSTSANDDGYLWGLTPTYACGPGGASYCSDIWGTS
jgi:hypothetical protein